MADSSGGSGEKAGQEGQNSLLHCGRTVSRSYGTHIPVAVWEGPIRLNLYFLEYQCMHLLWRTHWVRPIVLLSGEQVAF